MVPALVLCPSPPPGLGTTGLPPPRPRRRLPPPPSPLFSCTRASRWRLPAISPISRPPPPGRRPPRSSVGGGRGDGADNETPQKGTADQNAYWSPRLLAGPPPLQAASLCRSRSSSRPMSVSGSPSRDRSTAYGAEPRQVRADDHDRNHHRHGEKHPRHPPNRRPERQRGD